MSPLPPNADELVSAYLDGEATSDEIAVVESSPELMRRVQTMRELTERLDAPVSAPAEQKEAHIAAALSAFDTMFSTDTGRAGTEQVPSPTLVAAPEAAIDDRSGFESSSGVTSLAAARERRRPRKLNTGIIAAAAAAVLLFVAVAALSFGRGNDSADVATSPIEAAVAADDAGSDTTAMVEEAQDEEAQVEEAQDEATSDEEVDNRTAHSALNEQAEPDTAAPAEAPGAMQSADAVESAEMAAEEEAIEEEEADDGTAGETDSDAVEDSAEAAPLIDEFFVGVFPDEEALRLELTKVTSQDFDARSRLFEPGLFPGCQEDIAELAGLDVPTLVGEAIASARGREGLQ
jgi:hypothetical protein